MKNQFQKNFWKGEHTKFLKDIFTYPIDAEFLLSVEGAIFSVQFKGVNAEGVWLSASEELMDIIGAEIGEILFRKECEKTLFAIPFDFVVKHPTKFSCMGLHSIK